MADVKTRQGKCEQAQDNWWYQKIRKPSKNDGEELKIIRVPNSQAWATEH